MGRLEGEKYCEVGNETNKAVNVDASGEQFVRKKKINVNCYRVICFRKNFFRGIIDLFIERSRS